MNEEILKLAKEYGDWNGETVEMNDVGIESFYREAFNAGLEAAANECRNAAPTLDGSLCEEAIRTLEMKP